LRDEDHLVHKDNLVGYTPSPLNVEEWPPPLEKPSGANIDEAAYFLSEMKFRELLLDQQFKMRGILNCGATF